MHYLQKIPVNWWVGIDTLIPSSLTPRQWRGRPVRTLGWSPTRWWDGPVDHLKQHGFHDCGSDGLFATTKTVKGQTVDIMFETGMMNSEQGLLGQAGVLFFNRVSFRCLWTGRCWPCIEMSRPVSKGTRVLPVYNRPVPDRPRPDSRWHDAPRVQEAGRAADLPDEPKEQSHLINATVRSVADFLEQQDLLLQEYLWMTPV